MRSQKKHKPGLFEASISELTIDISDYTDETSDSNKERRIMNLLKKCDEFASYASIDSFQSIMALKVKIYAHSFAVKLMDYPMDLVKFKFFSMENKVVVAKLDPSLLIEDKIGFGLDKFYYFTEIFLDKPSFCYGLNLTFGVRSILKFIDKMKTAATDAPIKLDSLSKITKKGKSKLAATEKSIPKSDRSHDINSQETNNNNQGVKTIKAHYWDHARYKFHGK